MNSIFKRALAFSLSVILAFSALTLAVSAEVVTEDLIVYDLLKFDVDADTNICKTIQVFFQNQFNAYNPAKEIVFLDENGKTFAVCVPRESNNKMYDLYSPDKTVFGVEFTPSHLYYLVIPEGAYLTDAGIFNAEYKGEYNGVYITSNNDNYTIKDLEIKNFIAETVEENILYKGKILFSTSFKNYSPSNNSVFLYVQDGDDYTLIGKYNFISSSSGNATINFGAKGVELDKFSTYKIFVEYASITGENNLLCDHSEFVLSGKKLLGLREDYPWLDLLIEWFGVDHWTVEAVVTILEILSKIKLVDEALYKDIKYYVRAKEA